MSERDGYPAGVPNWVETLQDDPRAAGAFYAGVFDWELAGPGPMPGGGEYHVARLRGRDVAGIGSQPAGAPQLSSWIPYVQVDDVADAVARAGKAGGSVLAPPFDAGPAGRIAVLADPAGAAFCVWEPAERVGAQVVNEPGAWAMSLLHAPDPEAAAAFYGELFGWTTEAFGPFTMFRLPGYVGGEPDQPVSREVIATMVPAGDMPAQWSANFWVHDTDAAAAKAAELGGSVVDPPSDSPGFRNAVLADPSGVTFAISQLKR
jgi:predicted enzyme related to lactoylglutathione lyase